MKSKWVELCNGKYSWCTKTSIQRTIQIQIYKLISSDEKAFQFGQRIVILLRSKEKEKKTGIACTIMLTM